MADNRENKKDKFNNEENIDGKVTKQHSLINTTTNANNNKINNNNNKDNGNNKMYKTSTAADSIIQAKDASNSKLEEKIAEKKESGLGDRIEEKSKSKNKLGGLSGGDDNTNIEISNIDTSISNNHNNNKIYNNNNNSKDIIFRNNKTNNNNDIHYGETNKVDDRIKNGGSGKQDGGIIVNPDCNNNNKNLENSLLVDHNNLVQNEICLRTTTGYSSNKYASSPVLNPSSDFHTNTSGGQNQNNFFRQSQSVEDFTSQNNHNIQGYLKNINNNQNNNCNYVDTNNPNFNNSSDGILNSSYNDVINQTGYNNLNTDYAENNFISTNNNSCIEDNQPFLQPAQFYYDGTKASYELNNLNNNSNNNINQPINYNNNYINTEDSILNGNNLVNSNYQYDNYSQNNGISSKKTSNTLDNTYANEERVENFLKNQRLILDDSNFDESSSHADNFEDMTSYDYMRSDTILEGKRLLLESLRERNVNLEVHNQKLEREKLAVIDLLTCKKLDYERMKDHFNAALNDLDFQVQRLQSEKERLVEKLQLPESERSSLAAEETKIAELKRKLKEYEYKFEEFENENEDLKHEVRDLQLEMTELHDQFREEETLEFRELQKELESAAKNCRILQFKLKKAERHAEQAEHDRASMEERLKHFEGFTQGSDERRKNRAMEEDIRALKETNSRLHEEVARLDDRRRKGVEELDRSKNALSDTDSKRLCLQNEVDTMKHQINKLKDQLKYENRYDSNIIKPVRKGSVETDASILNQLAKDLKDSIERETDMKEQLKFTEKECTIIRKKLTEMEGENESLTLQIKKLTMVKSSRFLNKSKFDKIQEKESGLDKEGELALQAELAEQEVRSLKKNLEETQKENENLLCAIKYLRNKVEQREGSRCSTPFGEPKDSKDEFDKFGGPTEGEIEVTRRLEECQKELSAVKDKYQLLLEEMEQSKDSNHMLQDKDKESNLEKEQKWKTIQKDYEKVKTDCAVISKELSSILAQNTDLTKSLSELENTLNENEKLKKDREILSKEMDEFKKRLKTVKEEKSICEEKIKEISQCKDNETNLQKKISELEETLKEKTTAWDRERGTIEREANVGCDIATKINKEVANFNESLQNDKDNLLKDKENLVKEKQRLAEERDEAIRGQETLIKEKSQIEKSTKQQIQQLKDAKGFDEKQMLADKSKFEKQLQERGNRLEEMGNECEALSVQYEKDAIEKEKIKKEMAELENELQALKDKYEKKLTKEKEKRKKSEAFLEESKGDNGLLAKLQKDLEEKEKLIDKLNKKLKKSDEKLDSALKGSNSSITKSESSGSLSRRSSKSDTQNSSEGDFKSFQKENEWFFKESQKSISELKLLFDEEMKIWKEKNEDLKKCKENIENYKKKITKCEKEIEDLKEKLRNESSEKQKLQLKINLSEVDTSSANDFKKPSDEKKVSEFRNKFEKFGGTTKSIKRVSVPSALDVLSSPNGSNKIVKDLQKQIEDLEKKTSKERENFKKKNDKLKEDFEKESEEFKEKNKLLEEKVSEISKRQKELIETQFIFEEARLSWSQSSSDKVATKTPKRF